MFIGAALVMLAGAAWAAKQVYNFKGGVKTHADRGITKQELIPQPAENFFFTYTYTFMIYLEDDSSAMIQFTFWKVPLMGRHAILFSYIDRGEKQYLYKPVFDNYQYSYREDPPEFRLGPNFWKGFYPDFYVHLDLPADGELPAAKADLHFRCRTPGWRPGDGPTHYGAPDGDWYDLIVMIPWADLDGTVNIGDQTKKAKGFGYSDHNTQTVIPTDQLGEILALRSFSRDYSINFLEYIAPEQFGRTRTTWIMVMKGDRILFATDQWDRELHDMATGTRYNYQYPTRVTVKIDQPECKLFGEIKGVRFIEWIDGLAELPSFVRPIAEKFFEAPVFIRQNAVVDWHLVMPEEGIDHEFTNKGVFETTIVR
jgi:hypothetical protein